MPAIKVWQASGGSRQALRHRSARRQSGPEALCPLPRRAHGDADVSAVLYVSAPEESGHIVFRPILQNIKRDDLSCSYKPKVGMYLMFPGFLDHSVTRNFSDQKRISISFNFKRDEDTD